VVSSGFSFSILNLVTSWGFGKAVFLHIGSWGYSILLKMICLISMINATIFNMEKSRFLKSRHFKSNPKYSWLDYYYFFF